MGLSLPPKNWDQRCTPLHLAVLLNYRGFFMRVLWTHSILIPHTTPPSPFSPLFCPTVLFVPPKFSLLCSTTQIWLCVFACLGPTLYLHFNDVVLYLFEVWLDINSHLINNYPEVNTQHTYLLSILPRNEVFRVDHIWQSQDSSQEQNYEPDSRLLVTLLRTWDSLVRLHRF